MRTTKLGLAMLAALAAVASLTIGASGAQAANFTAAEYPAFILAEPSAAGTPTFVFEGGSKAECKLASFGGEMTKATAELKLELAVNECTNFGAAGAIATNGCEFVFRPGTGSADKFTGSFDIVCPAGQKIVVTGNTCEVQIGAQTGREPVGYERLTTKPNEVLATFQLKSAAGFAYTKTVDGASCPLSGTGSKTDGVITGGVRIKAASTKTFEPINFGIE